MPDAAALTRTADQLGLSLAGSDPARLAGFGNQLEAALASATVPDDPQPLFRYPIPKLSPDGTCSLVHELAAEPHDLRPMLGLADLGRETLRVHPESLRLARLSAAIACLHAATASDWSGIYERRNEGEDRLEKLAYRGRPSRAIFPLTEEFAARSNNSTAVLRRRGILVRNVEAHRAAGGAYYECDAAVESELCLPILRGDDVVGLIDLESFAPEHYGPNEIAAALHLATELVNRRLIG